MFTLPDLPLGGVLEKALRVKVANDRGLLLGGTGTDLWHGRKDAPDDFWMLCDRGPNGLVTVDKRVRRTFLLPEYTPLILHVRAAEGVLTMIDVVPIVGASGQPVTGLPNVEGHDEPPYDASGTARLPFTPSGIDCEGLVRTQSGELWLAEEYGPSLVRVGPGGKVWERLVPGGLALDGADYPVRATLPAILARRKDNRGFEGVALSADEGTLFAAVQSPLLVPDRATGEASRQVRILAVDTKSGKPSAEYVYRLESVQEFDPKTRAQSEMKVSALAVLDTETLLVLERTELVARVYAASLRGASDVLGTTWDDAGQATSLESLADPAVARVNTLRKELVVDLTALPDVPGKIEGLAIVDERTLAIANDNDFDVGTIGSDGKNQGKGARCRLWLVALAKAMR